MLHNGYTTNNDLQDMIDLWTHYSRNHKKQQVPVVFTEDNWSALPTYFIDKGNEQFCSDPQGCEGTYLVDLFTWLFDQGYAVSGANATSYEPIRVAWYRGGDSDRPLGLYSWVGGAKGFTVRKCGDTQSSYNTDETVVDPSNKNTTLAYRYNTLRYAACYRH